MKSLVLVVEHRRCICGATFTAPNVRPLTRHELANLRRSRAEILLDEGERHIPLREILHIQVPIDFCHFCFKTHNGVQFELFPKDDHLPLIFIDGLIKEQKAPAPNPYSLSYF